jgi:hypothetical protein
VSRHKNILEGLDVIIFIGKGSEWQTTRRFLHVCNRRKNMFCRLLKVHGIYNVRNVEIRINELETFEKKCVNQFL